MISLSHLLALGTFVMVMTGGQLLFKTTAQQVGNQDFLESLTTLLQLPLFWTACALYGASTVLWVWILARVPLSIAYPSSALALILVPMFSHLLFSEPLTPRYWIGLFLIVAGVVIIVER